MKRIAGIVFLILLLFMAICALVLTRSQHGHASLSASDTTLEEKQREWQKMKKSQSMDGEQTKDVLVARSE